MKVRDSWEYRQRIRERVAIAEDRQIVEGKPCDQCGSLLRFDYQMDPYRAFAVCNSCDTRDEF